MTVPIKPFFNNRILGAIAIIGAPMLLISFLLNATDSEAPKTLRDQLFSLAGFFYILGWMAGAVGMRQLRATGRRLGSKIVFVIQMVFLGLALIFSTMEVMGYSGTDRNLLFAVTDLGYPLSHLFMLVVGIFTVRADVWKGVSKVAPFIVGLALPVTLGLWRINAARFGLILFGILTMLGLGIIGLTVWKSSSTAHEN